MAFRWSYPVSEEMRKASKWDLSGGGGAGGRVRLGIVGSQTGPCFNQSLIREAKIPHDAPVLRLVFWFPVPKIAVTGNTILFFPIDDLCPLAGLLPK